MDAIEAIMTTRAMRRYTSEPVTDEEIWTCLRAANQAPSGGNIQPWRFLVLRDREVKRSVGAIYRKAYLRYRTALLGSVTFRVPEEERTFHRGERASLHLAEHLHEAQAIVLFIIPSFDLTITDDEGAMDIGTPYASVYPSVQNLMVAARALGIGTALTTVYRIYQDEVRAACGIPDRYEIVALVPMGRPAGRFGVAARRPVEELVRWDRWR